jgi:hypothetical protein
VARVLEVRNFSQLNEIFEEIWTKTIASPGNDLHVIRAVDSHDGGFILGCGEIIQNSWNQCVPNNYDSDQVLIKIDSEGNEIWRKTFGTCRQEPPALVSKTADGNYLYCGFKINDEPIEEDTYFHFGHICKFDSLGTILWEKIYGEQTYEVLLSKVIEMEDGNLVACGHIWQFGEEQTTRKGWLIKTDPEGEMLWERRYELETDVDVVFRDFIVTSDGGFAVVGLVHPWSENPHQDSWILKLDDCGCLEPNCNLECSTSVEESKKKIGLRIYPNPTSINSTVELALPSKQSLNVYNIQGQRIYTEDLNGRRQIILPCGNWEKGMYLVRIGDIVERMVVD